MEIYNKYLKYKTKYLNIKQQYGGQPLSPIIDLTYLYKKDNNPFDYIFDIIVNQNLEDAPRKQCSAISRITHGMKIPKLNLDDPSDETIILSKMSRKDLFKELANYNEDTHMSRVVGINEFINEYKTLLTQNGGSWCRSSVWNNEKVATMNAAGNVNFLWSPETDEEEQEVIKKFKMKNDETKLTTKYKGNKIIYIGIFGIDDRDKQRPIRDNIKAHYLKIPCVVCGSTSNLVCDHKNDLYNDPDVLNKEKQKLEDFQSLCNHCNLLKSSICKKTRKEKKISSYKNS